MLAELPDSQFKTQQIQNSIHLLARQDVGAANAWIEQHLDGTQADRTRISFLHQSFEDDPAAALAFVESIESPPERQNGIRTISYLWSRKDLTATLDWARRLPSDQDRQNAMQALAQRWAESDLTAAIDYANCSADPAIKATYQNAIAGILLQQSAPQQTLAYLDSLPDPTSLSSVYDQAIRSLAAVNPNAALRYLQDIQPEDATRLNAIQNLASEWSSIDPETAAPTLLSSGPTIATHSISPLVDSFASYDPERLLDLANQLPDAQLKAQMLASIRHSRQLEEYHPEILKSLQSILAP